MSSSSALDDQRQPKAFSCIRCFERKVKCDRLSPCSNCVRSKIECIFRVPPAPRRRKKRTQEDLLLARLKKCEELLKSTGIDIDGSDTLARTTSGTATLSSPPLSKTNTQQTDPDTQATNAEENTIFIGPGTTKPGRLMMDQGKSRFVENNLWASLSDEFQEPNEVIEEYSEDEDEFETPIEESTEFIFGYSPSGNVINQLHPSPTNLFIIWQIFLDNINPMTKFIHVPTMRKTLTKASQQLDNLPRGLEALMFAIYASAIYTLDDDECFAVLGEPRKTLLTRFRHATRKALARARFMTASELVVLQALTLYLFSMRDDHDPRTNWTLAGVATRIAHGMGLHRDGTGLGLSIFETEMRRRLWWQVIVLEGRSAELSGSGLFMDLERSDTLAPTNVDDEELWPEMTEPPTPKTRPTEMISCLLRIELSLFFMNQQKRNKKSFIDIDSLRLAGPMNSTLQDRDATMNDLEQLLEEKFLRYCDPSVPIQFMSIIIGRGAINMMRLMAHHPRKWGDQQALPPSEREYLWNISIKLLEAINMAHSSKQIRRFMWHTRNHFVWQALIFVLNELKQSTLGVQADKGWQQVEEIYLHHPQFVKDYKRPLHIAVGNLCLKAYAKREAALRETSNDVLPVVVPEYIQQLRELRETGPLQRATPSARDTSMSTTSSDLPPVDNANPFSPTLLGWDTFTPQTQNLSSTNTLSTPGGFHDQSNAAWNTQFPLPAFQPAPMPLFPDENESVMFASEPNLVHNLALTDGQLDWAQWDYIMRDSMSGDIPS